MYTGTHPNFLYTSAYTRSCSLSSTSTGRLPTKSTVFCANAVVSGSACVPSPVTPSLICPTSASWSHSNAYLSPAAPAFARSGSAFDTRMTRLCRSPDAALSLSSLRGTLLSRRVGIPPPFGAAVAPPSTRSARFVQLPESMMSRTSRGGVPRHRGG